MGPLKLIDILKPYAKLIAPFDVPGVPKFGGDFPVATRKRQNKVITLQLGTKIRFPGSSTEIPVSHLLLSYWMQDGRVMAIGGPSTQYEYKNVRTEETKTIKSEDVKLGFDTRLEAGKFYYQPELGFYYSESIEKNGALMFLIESYQNGQLVQAKAIVPFSDASDFLELTDKKEIERLKPVLEQFRKMDEKYADTGWARSWRERNPK